MPAEYRREQDWKRRNTGESGTKAAEYRREQDIAFVRKAFQTGEVEMQGTAITQCLPPLPLFSPNNERAATKQRVLDKLCAYFDRFYDIYEFE